MYAASVNVHRYMRTDVHVRFHARTHTRGGCELGREAFRTQLNVCILVERGLASFRAGPLAPTRALSVAMAGMRNCGGEHPPPPACDAERLGPMLCSVSPGLFPHSLEPS